MKNIKATSIILILCFSFQSINAQNFSDYAKKQLIVEKDTLHYRVLMPEKFKKNKKYPLVLFLHGAGERGEDNKKQLTHGAKLFLSKKVRRKYPAIVLFPQCTNGIMWTHRTKEKSKDGDWLFNFPLGNGPTKPAELVNLLVEDYIQKEYVDTNRIYVLGLSMGGIGTLEFLYRWPDKYASAISICGGHDPNLTGTYCKIPVWFFHGGKDNVVPIRYSQTVYDELKKCNEETKYTFYPEANHNSWDPAFAEPDLLKWLFKFKKEK